MKTINTSVCFCLMALALTSCYESELDATNSISDNDIEYLDSDGNFQGLINDDYRIIGITPVSPLLWNVIVEYSGGCERHQFVAWLPEESSAQKSLHLYHNGNSDFCEALIRDTIPLELDKIIDESQFSNTEQITLVNPSTSKSIEVDLELAALGQSNSCLHTATSVSSPCNAGVWEDQWFALESTHSSNHKIYLQPVANTNNVSLDTPEDGRYQVGITMLFGHVINSEACDPIQDVMMLPVAINCLTKL